MITLNRGIVNSLIVLEMLRNMDDLPNVTIGTFTNCREQGLTFAVTDGLIENWFTFCVYEHRNSDEIIINGKAGLISMNGELPYTGENKWENLAAFSYNQHYECAAKLAELIREKSEKALAKAA